MQGQHMLWRPHRNYLQTTLNCHEINVNFNIVVALLFVSIMMLNQHTVGPSTLFLIIIWMAILSFNTKLESLRDFWITPLICQFRTILSEQN